MDNIRVFKFEKESDNKWYIVLPEWTGDKSELEMVCGADVWLDIVARGANFAKLTVSEEEFEGHDTILTFFEEESDGGWYKLENQFHEFDVWLCRVTKFVFGHLPKVLYCK